MDDYHKSWRNFEVNIELLLRGNTEMQLSQK